MVRIGSYYELIADLLQRHFAVDLLADPDREALPTGHLREYVFATHRSKEAFLVPL